MKRKLYSKQAVDHIFSDVHPRTLRAWVESGLVQWGDERRDARGVIRMFAVENLYQLAIVRELTSISVPLSRIRHLMTSQFDATSMPEPMTKVVGIAMSRDVQPEKAFLAVGSRRPEEAESLLSFLLYSQVPIRPIDSDSRTKGSGRKYDKTFNPSIILFLNLPIIKERIDAKIKEMEG